MKKCFKKVSRFSSHFYTKKKVIGRNEIIYDRVINLDAKMNWFYNWVNNLSPRYPLACATGGLRKGEYDHNLGYEISKSKTLNFSQ